MTEQERRNRFEQRVVEALEAILTYADAGTGFVLYLNASTAIEKVKFTLR